MQPETLSKAQRSEALKQIDAELARRGVLRPSEVHYDFEQMPTWMADHPGQLAGWMSKKRRLALLAGNQSGKTDFASSYALRQLGRRGPGQALVCAPTFPLLVVALQPRLVKAIESRRLGEFKGTEKYIRVPYDSLRRCGYEGDEKGPLDIFLRHTTEAKHVEAVTAKWLIAEECGQMSDEVGEAIEARISATGGDGLYISRPYFDNWFRRMCDSPDCETEVVNFASWDNPGWRADMSPEARVVEIARLRASMPDWRFQMRYGGVFTRPAGAIYDCYVDELGTNEKFGHLEAPFHVPPYWERCYGIDFGSVHTCVRCYAKDPKLKSLSGLPIWHNYRTYFPNEARTVSDHVRLLRKWEEEDAVAWRMAGGWKEGGRAEVQWPPVAFGGNAGSEAGERAHWTLAGLPVQEPFVNGVNAGIERVYEAYADRRVLVFDTLTEARASKRRYSWKVDDQGDPLPGQIEDKSKFHFEDAERYFVPYTEVSGAVQSSRYRKEA